MEIHPFVFLPWAERDFDPVLGIGRLEHEVFMDDAQSGDEITVETGLARAVPIGRERFELARGCKQVMTRWDLYWYNGLPAFKRMLMMREILRCPSCPLVQKAHLQCSWVPSRAFW